LELLHRVLHLDQEITLLVQSFGGWTYAVLFVVVFCETGLVVTPFLPGDSLLFAAGAVATLAGSDGTTVLNISLVCVLLAAAAIAGDTVNYWAGHYIGPRAFSGHVRFLKQEYLERTHRFYQRYGGKTIVLARFVPIVRTFAPFVAGIGAMNYRRFIVYNVLGGVVWVALLTLGGYFFGNLPAVRRNFTSVILVIIVISVLPMLIEYVRAKGGKGEAAGET
jgi:membrane-associated protein